MLLNSKLSKLHDITALSVRLLQRRFPDFVYGGRLSGIPVFGFHEVEPNRFERQLKFLRDNGYRTLTMEEYYERVCTGRADGSERAVLLTFDDGWSSLWSIGLPLLKRYGAKVVLFLAAGRIHAGGLGPTLDDMEAARAPLSALLERDASQRPFLTWAEVRGVHESGLVDVQSHSVTHSHVFCSPDVEDFVRPGLLRCLPVTRLPEWTPDANGRVALGRPLYRSAPRMSECRRYVEDPQLRDTCERYVAQRGGAVFFERRTWRLELDAVTADYRRSQGERGRYETDAEREAALWRELHESKQMIERELAGKTVRHFCYPWDVGSELAIALSVKAGYVTNVVVQTPTREMGVTLGSPARISRFGEDWIFTLPGRGRRSFVDPVAVKLARWAKLPLKDGARARGLWTAGARP